MTVSTTLNRKSYAGNGVTTAFAVPFGFLAAGDLVVLLVDDTTGVPTTQTLTTDYTVTGAGGDSGTVTMLTAPPTGKTFVVYRDPAITQSVDPVPNDPLPVDTDLEQPLDRLTMIAQRNRDLVSRALRLKDSDTDSDATQLLLPVAADRAGNYLAFDADGNPIAAVAQSGTTPITAFAATVLDDLTAADARATLGVAADSAVVHLGGAETITGAKIFAGGIGLPVTTITAADSPFALGVQHAGLVLVDATDGNVTVNLPAANVLAALQYRFVRIDASANTATVNAAGADTIEGAASVTVNTRLTLISDGATSWKRVASDLASNADAAAGTDAERALTVAAAVGGLLGIGTSGYFKLPYRTAAGVLKWKIVQMGSATTTATGVTVTFPVAFPAGLPNTIVLGGNNTSAVLYTFQGQSSSAFVLQAWAASGAQVSGMTAYYVAIGE